MNILAKVGNLDNIVTYQHVCDTHDDLQNIPISQSTLGSTAIVLHGEDDEFEVFIATSEPKWIPFIMGSSGGGHQCVDLSNDTVDAQHLIYGYTAHDHTETAITGEIAIRDENDVIIEGGIATIPAGWYENAVELQTGGEPSTSPDTFDADVDNLIFIDYTGDILYRYTTEEALALTALPENPTHEGLVPQGWNWTLIEIQNYLTTYPMANVVVGQLYDTVSGATEIIINLTRPDKLSPVLYFYINPAASATIDWGDGTVQTISDVAAYYTPHTYATTGRYTIKFTTNSGAVYIGSGYSTRPKVFADQENFKALGYYDQTIEEMHINNNIGLYTTAFANLFNLKYITFSSDVNFNAVISENTLTNYFENDYSLRAVTLPTSVTKLQNTFSHAYSLQFCSVPNTINVMSSTVFVGNTVLKALTFPTTLTSVGQNGNITTIDGLNGGIVAHACLKTMVLPNTLTSLPTYGCSNAKNLVTIHLPTGLTTLPSYALYKAESIRELIIPDNITTISTYACYSMSRLEKVSLGSKVTSILSYAFANNISLLEFHINTTTPPTVQNDTFNNTTPLLTIYVPYSADHSVLTAYKNATNWAYYADQIQEEPQS